MSEELKPWREVFASMPQCPQRQDSLDDQLADLERVANKLGFYDASDYISAANRYIRRQEAKPMTVEQVKEAAESAMYPGACEGGGWPAIFQAIHAALPPVQPAMTVELGQGKVEVADGNHYGKPALLFGRNGCGEVGKEMNGDRYMEDSELIAAVTFDNMESLNVVLEMLNRCRARCFDAALPPAQSARTPSREAVKQELNDLYGELQNCFNPDHYNAILEQKTDRLMALWGKV